MALVAAACRGGERNPVQTVDAAGVADSTTAVVPTPTPVRIARFDPANLSVAQASVLGSTTQDVKPAALATNGDRVWFTLGARILRSDDGGATWVRSGDLADQINALSFASANMGWAATDSGLYATSDGGDRWLFVGGLPSGNVREVDFVDALRGWIVVGGAGPASRLSARLFRTTDGGGTWSEAAAGCRGTPFGVLTSFIDSNHGWQLCPLSKSAGGEARDLFITGDGGDSWTLFSFNGAFGNRRDEPPSAYDLPASGYANSISFVDADHGWITAARGGLEATTDGGRSWQPVRIPGLSDPDANGVSFSSPERGFVLGEGGVWRTTDGGATWKRVWGEDTVPVPDPRLPFEDPLLPYYRTYAYASGDGSSLWLVGGGILFRTDDAGEHWTRYDIPGVTPDAVRIVEPGHMVIGDLQAFYDSTDGGATWTRLARNELTGELPLLAKR